MKSQLIQFLTTYHVTYDIIMTNYLNFDFPSRCFTKARLIFYFILWLPWFLDTIVANCHLCHCTHSCEFCCRKGRKWQGLFCVLSFPSGLVGERKEVTVASVSVHCHSLIFIESEKQWNGRKKWRKKAHWHFCLLSFTNLLRKERKEWVLDRPVILILASIWGVNLMRHITKLVFLFVLANDTLL